MSARTAGVRTAQTLLLPQKRSRWLSFFPILVSVLAVLVFFSPFAIATFPFLVFFFFFSFLLSPFISSFFFLGDDNDDDDVDDEGQSGESATLIRSAVAE